ncbi:putative leader peptide [Nocardioides sp. MH1]
MDTRLVIRDADWVAPPGARSVVDMSTTWLTKRRAVDNCRVSSALCRMR